MSTTPAINFTDSAAHKVWELINEENNSQLKLRVYIMGGGCSGYKYEFAFEENTQEDDIIITKNVNVADDGSGTPANVQLLVDPMSYQYLMGAEIDFAEDVEGERFIIRNPNATTTCGCGSSFSA